jgi:hypothetical protein
MVLDQKVKHLRASGHKGKELEPRSLGSVIDPDLWDICDLYIGLMSRIGRISPVDTAASALPNPEPTTRS